MLLIEITRLGKGILAYFPTLTAITLPTYFFTLPGKDYFDGLMSLLCKMFAKQYIRSVVHTVAVVRQWVFTQGFLGYPAIVPKFIWHALR